MADVSKLKIDSTSYNIKDVTARTIKKITGLSLTPTSTTKTYQNNNLKGAHYVDIFAGNSSAEILNRVTRVYPGTNVGEYYTIDGGNSESCFYSFDATTGTLSYKYDNLQIWSSNVITISAIHYQ